MSFWQLDDGSEVEASTTYSAPAVDLAPIPKDTRCLSAIESAAWSEYGDDRYINIKWRVMDPKEYGNRVVFHKVKVFGTSQCKDPKSTAAKAKKMLAAIDANAGGKLMALGREPTDDDLMSNLTGKVMHTTFQVWSMKNRDTGEQMTGNWVSEVSPAKGDKAAPADKSNANPAPDFDSDIPF